jgi:hypothetical protein
MGHIFLPLQTFIYSIQMYLLLFHTYQIRVYLSYILRVQVGALPTGVLKTGGCYEREKRFFK